jgi:aromatic ring-opening dioxygenase catalytic subunit (LigB family)
MNSLKDLPRQVGAKPEAIVVVSGHWVENDFAITASDAPPSVSYPAPGSPELAHRLHAMIQDAGLAAHLDTSKGFDRGTYAILGVPYSRADIPVVQISIRSDYDPESHLRLGRAIAALRDEKILIVGSGMSYRSFHPASARVQSEQFDSWLERTLVNSTPRRRSKRLLEWEAAPSARAAHPQADHFIPLHVVVGAAEEELGEIIYREENFFGKLTVSSYRFG